MLKKLFFHPLSGLGYIVSLSWLCTTLTGPPRTPLELLGALSLTGIVAVVVLFVVASVRYRPDGGVDGTGILSVLILCLGATVIVLTLAASAFGTSLALTYAGMAAIAALTTIAMRAITKGDR